MKTLRDSLCSKAARHLATALALAALGNYALAAATDIASAPLFTSSSSLVKPNIMFILDDSGSMKNDYMPDEANFATTKYGKLSAHCNGVAYNPDVTYALPVDANANTLAAGDTAVLDPNPIVQTTNQRGFTLPLLVTVPATVGNSLTLTVSGTNPRNSWYTAGDVVTIFSTDSKANYVVATVTSWNNTTRALVVKITSSAGTATMSTNLRVGDGAPSSPLYYKYTGTQKDLNYSYNGSGVIKDTFYNECDATLGASTLFTTVTVNSASAEAQNYANWYAYYRTRISMAKSAISRSFSPLGDRYRVGYSTIGETGAADTSDFLNVRTFDATQKTSFYSNLSNATPGGYTPLRGALSKAGRYFANKVSGQTDPIQYSCQKNFTILSTDGYWNTHDESSSYTALGVDGTNVGQRDGLPAKRPQYDGGTTTTARKITWNSVQTVVNQQDTTKTTYTGATNTAVDTYTPQSGNSGSKTTSYTLGTIYNSTSNSTITQSCTGSAPNISCTITVTPASMANIVVGASVTISGTNQTAFNKTFTVTALTGGGTRYRFVISGLSANTTLPTTLGNSFTSPVGCPSGQGQLTTTVTQTDKFNRSSVTTTSATAQNVITHTQTQTQTATPYTQNQTLVNGTITADSGPIKGTTQAPVVTALPSLPTDLVGGTSAYTSVAAPVATTNVTPPGYTPSVLSSGTSCAATKPSNTTVAAAAVATTTVITNTAVAATVADKVLSGPTTTKISDTTADTTHIPVDTNTTTGGSTDSLADVAEYYYDTDLRDASLGNCQGALGSGTDVCGVTTGANIKNPVQNMTSFTIGLGVNGTLKYDKAYADQTTGDFHDIMTGDKNWPIPTVSDSGGDPTNIDDLWHAAVNGRGQYFSAGNPAQLVDSLTSVLQQVTAITGTASAAATSTLQPVAGDNDVFVAQFTTVSWTGDVLRYSIDPDLGTISATSSWSAAAQLDARNLGTNPRNIYYFKPGTGVSGTRRDFTYANLTTDGLNGNFDSFCTKTGAGGSGTPQQCALIIDKTEANKGTNLVDYLRGAANSNYRTRSSRLGDIISGAPIFVGAPKFKYTENGYVNYATKTIANGGQADRAGVVYVAGNDGMLHAFDRLTGDEKWAYIPSMMIPNLYKLADAAYAYNHQYYVDGAPQVGDIFVGGAWKTILVGGLNAGGRAYYALDVTDPTNPVPLWEFSNSATAGDVNLGLTFGNPIITKRADGTWVVVFASGYNNTVGSGDGNGHLFVLNANTGAKLVSIPTLDSTNSAVGSTGSPSGLAKINAWVDSEIDNTAKRFYGGDLLGNLWRFDVDNLVAPNGKALQLALFKVGTKVQPITTKPALAEVNYSGAKYPVAFIGTGEYLGSGDLSNTDLQSVYAIKDPLTGTGYGNIRAGTSLVQQTLTTTTSGGKTLRKITTPNPVDWTSKAGWQIDLPSSGERVNVNVLLVLNVLSVASNVPSSDACDAGGSSFLYGFDIGTGAAAPGAPDGAAGVMLENVLIAGQTAVQLKDGSTDILTTTSEGKVLPNVRPPSTGTPTLRRTSWRELAN